jgi:hypothetical protein
MWVSCAQQAFNIAKQISHNEIALRLSNPIAAAWNQRHQRRVRYLRMQSSAATATPCGMNCDCAILHCCSYNKRWNKYLLMTRTKNRFLSDEQTENPPGFSSTKSMAANSHGNHISSIYEKGSPVEERYLWRKTLMQKRGLHRFYLSLRRIRSLILLLRVNRSHIGHLFAISKARITSYCSVRSLLQNDTLQWQELQLVAMNLYHLKTIHSALHIFSIKDINSRSFLNHSIEVVRLGRNLGVQRTISDLLRRTCTRCCSELISVWLSSKLIDLHWPVPKQESRIHRLNSFSAA